MSEGQHHIITTISEMTAVCIRCVCGKQLMLRRGSLESIMSGVFCQECDEQYWIRWSEGILRRGDATQALREQESCKEGKSEQEAR